MTDYVLSVEDWPSTADVQMIHKGLAGYNRTRIGEMTLTELAVFLRDKNDRIVGGAFGELFWNWLYIDLLWVEHDCRGHGYGSQIMATIEQAAVARNVCHVYLATTSFQARPFYQKLGYAVYAQLPDRPPGHDYYYLQKMHIPAQPVEHGLYAEESPAKEDVRALRNGLREYVSDESNISVVSQPLSVFVRNAEGVPYGGLYGRTYWGWFDCIAFWLDRRLRGKGYGSQILALAEAECRQRHITGMVLDVTGFQSLAFFEHQGFEIFGTLADRPLGHTAYFLKKHLA